MKIVLKKIGFVDKIIYYINMIRYKHKHVYVYQFDMQKKDSPGYSQIEYTLCTNHDGPNTKENRKLLEEALRTVYRFNPKGVKYLYEK
jgi:hypothetical protein